MSVSVFADEHALIKFIEDLSLKSQGIVSVDGVDKVGQTTLACNIAEKMNFPCIEIAPFYYRNFE
jgi:hypothetical protein